MEVKFIDLFAGIGGFRLGLEQSGFRSVFSSEIDENCKETYFANYGEMPEGDITKIDAKDIDDFDILSAGFPCQPFSISGKQLGFEDTRGTLFFDILRIIKTKKPKVVLLENVKHLVHHDKGNTLKVILMSLRQLDYEVNWKVLNASDFGVPQNRERIIIIASRGKQFDFDNLNTVEKPILRDFLDTEGNFEYLDDTEYSLLINPTVQRSGLIFVGYRNKKIRVAGVKPNTEHLSRVHKQPNRIYSVDGVHPTLPSQETSGRFFILVDGRVRKLTINECYRITGFPKFFKRINSLGEQYKQIGNSVCVPMVAELGREIKSQFFNNKRKTEIQEIQSREDKKSNDDSYSNITINL
ncbi:MULTISPECIES: DNA cytosine methyltransferase [unclassified Sporosarcina]|uniref:DNA cytosine methyltransferase n=1 Tax=unclassified Sporosarcina TaxID=2647733 RepID=UPI00203F0318|nr:MULTISPECIES: DNA cytosine methyltransferase [unclassified Sporosarcina]GKV65547.1 cytosine-specific methyltransferase [Sporosarcina sp. NCCP-2331]GLB55672.1 cytosine-specific methyltransferase [Sporosarcina sp. NCCP-2378]